LPLAPSVLAALETVGETTFTDIAQAADHLVLLALGGGESRPRGSWCAGRIVELDIPVFSAGDSRAGRAPASINTCAPPDGGRAARITQMPYSNVTTYPRPWNREVYPVVAHIEIEAKRWHELERRIGDQTQAQVLGHDDAGGELLVAHVACTSDAVARRLTVRWSA
jgi:hypothetical protein